MLNLQLPTGVLNKLIERICIYTNYNLRKLFEGLFITHPLLQASNILGFFLDHELYRHAKFQLFCNF